MARLVKLFDERQLLVNMQADTLILIRDCHSIEPIKKFVQCHEILNLTWAIQEKYPRIWPDSPECDESALLHLRILTQELVIGYGAELPRPGFDSFDLNVRRLLRVFGVPKGAFQHARLEDGTEATSANDEPDLPTLFIVDGSLRRPKDEK